MIRLRISDAHVRGFVSAFCELPEVLGVYRLTGELWAVFSCMSRPQTRNACQRGPIRWPASGLPLPASSFADTSEKIEGVDLLELAGPRVYTP